MYVCIQLSLVEQRLLIERDIFFARESRASEKQLFIVCVVNNSIYMYVCIPFSLVKS